MVQGKTVCLIVAAGSGSRMGGPVKKQFLPLLGRPVIAWTTAVMESLPWIDQILLVIQPEDELEMTRIASQEGWKKTKLIYGGARRQDSVLAGLCALPEETTLVLIHDGARPLVRPEEVQAVWQKAQQMGAAVLAVPVKATIKAADHHQQVERTVPRDNLWEIQTPQVFEKDLLCRAYEAVGQQEVLTDDAMAVEALGAPVALVAGSYRNLKLTTPEDMLFAEALITQGEKHQVMTAMQPAAKSETRPSGGSGKKEVVIYTDGACSGNPGPGGYGVVLLSQGKRREISAGYRKTTNNRMELMAVIRALEELKMPCQVTLYSDSKYVVDAVEKGWAKKWKQNGWMRTKTERALNSDLWERLLSLLEQNEVAFRWVKGHVNHPENERCDQLATTAAAGDILLIDQGYEK